MRHTTQTSLKHSAGISNMLGSSTVGVKSVVAIEFAKAKRYRSSDMFLIGNRDVPGSVTKFCPFNGTQRPSRLNVA